MNINENVNPSADNTGRTDGADPMEPTPLRAQHIWEAGIEELPVQLASERQLNQYLEQRLVRLLPELTLQELPSIEVVPFNGRGLNALGINGWSISITPECFLQLRTVGQIDSVILHEFVEILIQRHEASDPRAEKILQMLKVAKIKDLSADLLAMHLMGDHRRGTNPYEYLQMLNHLPKSATDSFHFTVEQRILAAATFVSQLELDSGSDPRSHAMLIPPVSITDDLRRAARSLPKEESYGRAFNFILDAGPANQQQVDGILSVASKIGAKHVCTLLARNNIGKDGKISATALALIARVRSEYLAKLEADVGASPIILFFKGMSLVAQPQRHGVSEQSALRDSKPAANESVQDRALTKALNAYMKSQGKMVVKNDLGSLIAQELGENPLLSDVAALRSLLYICAVEGCVFDANGEFSAQELLNFARPLGPVCTWLMPLCEELAEEITKEFADEQDDRAAQGMDRADRQKNTTEEILAALTAGGVDIDAREFCDSGSLAREFERSAVWGLSILGLYIFGEVAEDGPEQRMFRSYGCEGFLKMLAESDLIISLEEAYDHRYSPENYWAMLGDTPQMVEMIENSLDPHSTRLNPYEFFKRAIESEFDRPRQKGDLEKFLKLRAQAAAFFEDDYCKQDVYLTLHPLGLSILGAELACTSREERGSVLEGYLEAINYEIWPSAPDFVWSARMPAEASKLFCLPLCGHFVGMPYREHQLLADMAWQILIEDCVRTNILPHLAANPSSAERVLYSRFLSSQDEQRRQGEAALNEALKQCDFSSALSLCFSRYPFAVSILNHQSLETLENLAETPSQLLELRQAMLNLNLGDSFAKHSWNQEGFEAIIQGFSQHVGAQKVLCAMVKASRDPQDLEHLFFNYFRQLQKLRNVVDLQDRLISIEEAPTDGSAASTARGRISLAVLYHQLQGVGGYKGFIKTLELMSPEQLGSIVVKLLGSENGPTSSSQSRKEFGAEIAGAMLGVEPNPTTTVIMQIFPELCSAMRPEEMITILTPIIVAVCSHPMASTLGVTERQVGETFPQFLMRIDPELIEELKELTLNYNYYLMNPASGRRLSVGELAEEVTKDPRTSPEDQCLAELIELRDDPSDLDLPGISSSELEDFISRFQYAIERSRGEIDIADNELGKFYSVLQNGPSRTFGIDVLRPIAADDIGNTSASAHATITPAKLAVKLASAFDLAGVRAAQLVRQFYRLRPEVDVEFNEVYDKRFGQNKLPAWETIKRADPQLASRTARLCKKEGGGAFYTVFEAWLTDGKHVVDKVLNPNALPRFNRFMEIFETAQKNLVKSFPEYRYVAPLLALIKRWVIAEFNARDVFARDEIYREQWDGWQPHPGQGSRIVVPAMIPTQSSKVFVEMYVEGRNLTNEELRTSARGAAAIALLEQHLWTQLTEPNVGDVCALPADWHLGNFRETLSQDVAVLDRQYKIELTGPDRDILAGILGAHDPKERSRLICEFLKSSEENREISAQTFDQMQIELATHFEKSNALKDMLELPLIIHQNGVELPLRFALLFRQLHGLECARDKFGIPDTLVN